MYLCSVRFLLRADAHFKQLTSWNRVGMNNRAKAVAYSAALLLLLLAGPGFGTSPQMATLPQAVQRDEDLSLAYRAILASGERANALSSRESDVTFLAPNDASCEGIGELHAQDVNTAWAGRFVLSHTFQGQISTLDIPGPYGHSLRLSVKTRDGQDSTVMDKGSITVTNLLGREKRISVKDGAITLDGHIHIHGNILVGTQTGNIGVIDDCREL